MQIPVHIRGDASHSHVSGTLSLLVQGFVDPCLPVVLFSYLKGCQEFPMVCEHQKGDCFYKVCNSPNMTGISMENDGRDLAKHLPVEFEKSGANHRGIRTPQKRLPDFSTGTVSDLDVKLATPAQEKISNRKFFFKTSLLPASSLPVKVGSSKTSLFF